MKILDTLQASLLTITLMGFAALTAAGTEAKAATGTEPTGTTDTQLSPVAVARANAAAGAQAKTAAGSQPAAAPPTARTADKGTTAPPDASSFTALDIPDWVILDPEDKAKTRPWILVVDDPQCPYCMQLHLALAKERELNDPEISGAVVARLPYPLAYHDQSAHIVSDAFCLEASRSGRSWSAASYLDWLIVAPWRSEPEWKTATIDDIGKDNGFFDAKYDAHRVTSSRRRDFQTEQARAESACSPDICRDDQDCLKLCGTLKGCQTECRKASPDGAASDGSHPVLGTSTAGTPPAAAGQPAPGGTPSQIETCFAGCTDRFVSARYRQYSKVHSECLLQEGPGSSHGKTAAAVAWGSDHKVPGTPTVYVGNPSVGFRTLGDSDHLSEFMSLLREGLVQTRQKMSAVQATH